MGKSLLGSSCGITLGRLGQIESLGHGKRFGILGRIRINSCNPIGNSCKVTYLILVERRVALSPRRRLINTKLDKQIDCVLFLSPLLFWIIVSSSLSSLYLVACYTCPTHQFIIGVSLSSNSQQLAPTVGQGDQLIQIP